MSRMRAVMIGLLLLLLGAQPQRPPRIVTSIYPLASITRAVGGNRVSVSSLVPRGADPHNFELTPSAAAAIEKADRIFLIGGPFDEWFAKWTSDRKRQRVVLLYEAFEDSLIPLGKTFNPHIWLDPLMARQIAEIVAASLEDISPSDSSYFGKRLEEFKSQIDSLDAWIRRNLARASLDEFVSLHPAWSYFARRYGLEERATIEISHEHEPSPRHVAHVIRILKSMKSRCIVAEEFSNPALAQSVADAAGATVVMLDPLGGADLEDRSSYIDLIRYNVNQLVIACTNKESR